jgi:hypothetical protein
MKARTFRYVCRRSYTAPERFDNRAAYRQSHVVRRTQSPSADVATSSTSNPAARRRSAAAERTRAFSPTIKTTGFSITTTTRVDCPK